MIAIDPNSCRKHLLGMHFKARQLIPALLLSLAGCSGLLLKPAPAHTEMPLPGGVDITYGNIASSTGCRLDYRVYSSVKVDDGDLVVLAHGFLRSQNRMRILAATLADAGMRVATLDFCNSSPWDGRHAQNGLDMVALARALGARRIVYAGFSAGGLAAVIAGRTDPTSVGIVTLDLVETQGLGVRAATGLGKPLLGLAGEPTNCNALDNGKAVFAATDWARVQRIEDANHCDFEAPTDRLCEFVCSKPSRTPRDPEENAKRAEIIASATLAVRSLLDGDGPASPGKGDWSRQAQ
ncbi:MAG: alpha/beta hydrolase [Thiohalocapsa sp.]